MSIYSIALEAHNNWASDFKENILDGQYIDVSRWGANNQCQVGKWLSGIEPQVGTKHEYQTAVQVHNSIHKCAETIARCAREGEHAKVEKLIPVFEKLRHYMEDALHGMDALHRSLIGHENQKNPANINMSHGSFEWEDMHLLQFIISFSHETDMKFIDRQFLHGFDYYLQQLFGKEFYSTLNSECGELIVAMDQQNAFKNLSISGWVTRLKLNIILRIVSHFTNFEHSVHTFLKVVENRCEGATKSPNRVTFMAFFDPLVTMFSEMCQDGEHSKTIRFMFSKFDIDTFNSIKMQYHKWLEWEQKVEVA